MHNQPCERAGKANYSHQQCGQHRSIHLDVTIATQHTCILMQRAPQQHAEMNKWNFKDSEQGNYGRATRTLFERTTKTAHCQITDIRHQQKCCRCQSWVPCPESTPRDATPQAATQQSHGHKDHADFRRCSCNAVETHRMLTAE